MDPNTIIVIITVALAISEGLSFIPAVKANGVFQAVYNLLKALKGGGISKNKTNK